MSSLMIGMPESLTAAANGCITLSKRMFLLPPRRSQTLVREAVTMIAEACR